MNEEKPISNAPNITKINLIAILGLFTAIFPELIRKAIIPEKNAKYSKILVLLSFTNIEISSDFLPTH